MPLNILSPTMITISLKHYVPSSDTYIAKDSAINDEIDKLRHSATASLSERTDVIIVASVSCIYGLGAPIDYKNMTVSLRPGDIRDRDDIIRKLIDIQYNRNEQDFHRGTFRVRGDVLEVFPASSSDDAIRIEFLVMKLTEYQYSTLLQVKLRVFSLIRLFSLILTLLLTITNRKRLLKQLRMS